MFSEDFGNFPKISKEKLLRDLELLYQGLDKYHSGMYWYTPKDSVDKSFEQVKKKITRDLNVLEFHKLIAPLVALSREDHTNIELPAYTQQQIKTQANFLPLRVVFLGEKLYCVHNGSDLDLKIEGKQIEAINGESLQEIVEKIGTLFASDGFIKTVKYNDLNGFAFSKYLYFYYGNLPTYTLQVAGQILQVKAITLDSITKNLKERYNKESIAPIQIHARFLWDCLA